MVSSGTSCSARWPSRGGDVTMTGKAVFLADGEPTGILLAEISNWNGKVLVAPRSQLTRPPRAARQSTIGRASIERRRGVPTTAVLLGS